MRISCLMVTLPERRQMMVRAVEAWVRQSYPDRELVVVIDQGPPAARAAAVAALGAFGRNDIRVVVPEAPLTLGALRNLAVDCAGGALVCLWDDDDLHHPQRLARQLAAMTEADCVATVLQEAMLYRAEPRILHWINWAATPAGGLPGTLLCHRALLPRYAEHGPAASLGEDLDLLLRLRAAHRVHAQPMEPHLYVYVTHGANSWGADHHALLAQRLSISAGLLRRRQAALREGLQPFDFEGVSVEGPNGRAFSL